MTADGDDVCIVGGGTVGLLAAHLLAAGGRRVTVLEAGQRHGPALGAAVRQTEGVVHAGKTRARGFGLGGTSQLWGGQLWAWTPEEISARPHVGVAAWPIDYEHDLLRAYRAVADVLPLTADQIELLARGDVAGLADQPSGRWLTCLSWRSRNFGRVFPGSGGAGPGFRVVSDSVVQRIETADGACTGVTYLDGAGNSRTISASEVVLAAGTLGNVALLSTIDEQNPCLGQGFMDHLSARMGTLEVVDRRRFRQRAPVVYRRGARFVKRFLPPADFEERHGLPSGFAQIELDRPAALVALRSILRARQGRRSLSDIARLVPGLLLGLPAVLATVAWPYVVGREYLAPGTQIQLWVSIEQLPAPANHLAAQAGQVDMHWGHTSTDIAALAHYSRYFAEEFDWASLGLRIVDTVQSTPTDTFHMMGGTRMAERPHDGVVDQRGRVFGVRNLRVVGASVFPTGGVANPTFTACATTWLTVEDILDGGRGDTAAAQPTAMTFPSQGRPRGQ